MLTASTAQLMGGYAAVTLPFAFICIYLKSQEELN